MRRDQQLKLLYFEGIMSEMQEDYSDSNVDEKKNKIVPRWYKENYVY